MHQQDVDERDVIYNQDFEQIADLRDALDDHIKQNIESETATREFIESMKPLIPVLKSMAEKQMVDAAMSRKVAKIIGVVSGAIVVIGGAIGIIWGIMQIVLKMKEF